MSYTNNTKDYSDERRATRLNLNQLSQYPEFAHAVRLARQVVKLTAGREPHTPAGSWADQLFRSATSVPANIAEGHGRMQRSQVVQFYRHARGSSFECVSHLLCCPLDGVNVTELRQEYGRLITLIDATLADLIDQ